MKRALKKIVYCSPEINIGLGLLTIYFAVSGHQQSTEGVPQWVMWGYVIGLVFLGFGSFLAKVREEVNTAKKRK